MPKYTARIAFDVPYYATIEFEAENDEAAIEHAKDEAREATPEYHAAWEHADDHRVVQVTKGDDEIEIVGASIPV